MEIVERLVRFIHPETGLQAKDIPAKIRETAKLQLLGNIAAIAHGKNSRYYRQIPRPRSKSGLAEWAGYLSSLSMVFDYDDFMFAGHTGHTSAMLPLLYARDSKLKGNEILAATVMANEIGGRLGGSIFLGPHNGQLWTPIHQLMAAAILVRFDAAKMKRRQMDAAIRNAVKGSLAYPVYPLFDTFFSSSAKVFTASNALQQGIKNYYNSSLSAPDPFRVDSSFYELFAYVPLTQVWADLGERYYSDTLSFKKFPGCAYIAGPVEACEQIARQMKDEGVPAGDIKRVKIWGNLLSKKMDDLSRPHLKGRLSSATSLNFSLPINCAIMLYDGKLTPASFSESSLDRESLWDLCNKTKVRHSPVDSARMLKHSSMLPNPFRIFAGNHLRLKSYRKKYGLGADMLTLPRDIIQSAFYPRAKVAPKTGEYQLLNGATVKVYTSERVYTASVGLPTGFAGTQMSSMKNLVFDKLAGAVKKPDYKRIKELVLNLEKLTPKETKELAGLMCRLA